MAKVGAGTSIKAKRQTKRKTERRATKEARAWIGAVVETIRSGSPDQVLARLEELEEEGHVVQEETTEVTEVNTEELLENDSELEIVDEDFADFEMWGDRQHSFPDEILLKSENHIIGREEYDPFMNNDCFELIVEENRCVFYVPDWVGRYRGVTSIGRRAIYEIDSRLEVLQIIAEWLGTERSAFLSNPDWLNLGPKDYEEVKSKVVTVTQETLRDYLLKDRKDINIQKSEFSRYLEACRIVWPNGSMPLKYLFSQEARMGWVAKSIKLAIENEGFALPNKEIKRPRSKLERQSLLDMDYDYDEMDVETFVIHLNELAKTSWREVYETYFEGV